MAKYLSNAGVRNFSWSMARYGVSQRMRGSSRCRRLYRHFGSALWSSYHGQLEARRQRDQDVAQDTQDMAGLEGHNVAREGTDAIS